MGEAVGLYTTLDWISNQQFDDVDFVVDCKKVVDCVNSSLDDSSEFGCIINGCKQLLEDRFQNSHVEFNRRQANRIAHELAQEALSNPSPHIIDDVPTYIWHILANETLWIYYLKKKKIANDGWGRLKREFHGNDKLCANKLQTISHEFGLMEMKESKTVKDYYTKIK